MNTSGASRIIRKVWKEFKILERRNMGYQKEIYAPLNVHPEKLLQGVSEARQIIRNMQSLLSGMEQAAERSERYWKGEAGDEHRAYFSRLRQVGEKVLSDLGNSVTDLERITAVYMQTEQTAEGWAEALPGDVIQ